MIKRLLSAAFVAVLPDATGISSNFDPVYTAEAGASLAPEYLGGPDGRDEDALVRSVSVVARSGGQGSVELDDEFSLTSDRASTLRDAAIRGVVWASVTPAPAPQPPAIFGLQFASRSSGTDDRARLGSGVDGPGGRAGRGIRFSGEGSVFRPDQENGRLVNIFFESKSNGPPGPRASIGDGAAATLVPTPLPPGPALLASALGGLAALRRARRRD